MGNQIDNIPINKRFKNSLRQVGSHPGANCRVGCDHVLVVTEMWVKFKRTKRTKKVKRNWNILRRNGKVREQ